MTKKLIFLSLFVILLNFTNQLIKKDNSCTVNEDCDEMNYCVNYFCKHKNFFPITYREVIGSILIIIGSALSNAGGLGGGGLLVPILISCLNFNTKEAIPISKLMIFTGSFTAFIMGIKNKNPYRGTTAIDYNLAIIIIPLVLFGTMIGVTLNKIFPPTLILILLTVLLFINTYKTMKKGFDLYTKENILLDLEKKKLFKLKNLNENKNEYDEESGLILEDKVEEGENLNIREFNSITRKALLINELEKDRVLLPFHKVIFSIISYLVLLMVTLFKGSDHFHSIIGIKICSPMYWAVYLSYLPICLIITYIVGRIVYEEYNYRKEIGYPYHSSDIKWNKELIIRYPIYALSAGICSGLLGIGGGTILGPMLLDLGIHPVVSTATSNFLVVFISSSTTLQYVIQGMMNFNYGLICTIISTFGSYMGTYLIQNYLEKTKRHSSLVFILAAVLLCTMIVVPTNAFIQVINKLNKGINIWEFHLPC